MRISYFVPSCSLENSHGRYVIELCKHFGREHDVSVFSSSFWSPLKSIVQCRELVVLRRPAIGRIASLWLQSLLVRQQGASDIIHIQGADAPVGNVVTAHFCNQVMVDEARKESTYRRFNYRMGALVERFTMSRRSTRKVIAVSSRLKKEIVDSYGVDPKKVSVIHHGVDCSEFSPANRNLFRDKLRATLGYSEKHIVLLFVGGDYRRKGLITLLRSIRLLPNHTRVLAVGIKPDSTLLTFLRDLGIDNLVSFVNPTANMAPYYSAADCFVLPTLYDPFSLATLEAMASGLPVVVSRVAGVSEMLTANHDCEIIDDPTSVDQLASILSDITQDAGHRSALASNARETAESHPWEKVAAKTMQVYSDVTREEAL